MRPYLLWLFAAVVSAGEHGRVELSGTKSVTAACHEKATIYCNITSSEDNLSIKYLSWIHESSEEELCTVREHGIIPNESHRIRCHYTPQKQLVLTIRHAKPVHQGRYICKLRTNHGTAETHSTIKLRECHGKFHQKASYQVNCSISGVYPEGRIHWFDGDRNLTADAVQHPSMDEEEGLLMISSSLTHKHGTETYNCSLWMDSIGGYITSHLIHVSNMEHGSRAKSHASYAADRSNASRAQCQGWVFFWVVLFFFVLRYD